MYVHIWGKLLAAVKKVTVYNIELCSDHRGHRVLARIFKGQVQSVFEGPQDLTGAVEQGVAGGGSNFLLQFWPQSSSNQPQNLWLQEGKSNKALKQNSFYNTTKYINCRFIERIVRMCCGLEWSYCTLYRHYGTFQPILELSGCRSQSQSWRQN